MLKAAVIGLGVGEQHIYGYNSHSQCKTVALCDSNPAKLAEVAQRHNINYLSTNADHILSDPSIDIVSIASYDDVHADQVLLAIENGKHIFVEKPLCLSEYELQRIYSSLQKS